MKIFSIVFVFFATITGIQIANAQEGNNFPTLLASGIYSFEMGKYEDARRDLEEAYKLNSEDFNINLYLGLTLSRLGNYSSAYQYLKTSTLKVPSSRKSVTEFLIVLVKLEKYDEAVDILEKAKEKDIYFEPLYLYASGMKSIYENNLDTAEENLNNAKKSMETRKEKEGIEYDKSFSDMIDEGLDRVYERKKLWILDLAAVISLLYNSNVRLVKCIGDACKIDVIEQRPYRDWDIQGFFSLQADFTYKFPNIHAGLGYTFIGDFYTEFSNYDFAGNVVRPSILYTLSKDENIGIKDYLYFYTQSRKSFLFGNDFEGTGVFRIGPGNLQPALGFGILNYLFPQLEGRDATKIYVSATYTLPFKYITPYISAVIANYSAKDKAFAYLSIAPSLGFNLTYKSLNLNAGASIFFDSYNDVYPGTVTKRKDNIISANIGIGTGSESAKIYILYIDWGQASSNIESLTWSRLRAGTRAELYF